MNDTTVSHFIGTAIHPAIDATGMIKVKPEDFLVVERLNFQPSGHGEHIYLRILKRNMNTEFIARKLAKIANIKERFVSYSGRKDRYALTKQWFSVWLPGCKQMPDWQKLKEFCDQGHDEYCEIVEVTAHDRKLRPGTHKANYFEIIVRDTDCTPESLDQQIKQVEQVGVANYFGKQRFGHDTLDKIRHKTIDKLGFFEISVLRSHLFNLILDYRAKNGLVSHYLDGDIIQLDGSHSIFIPEQWDSHLQQRLEQGDIHISGPLWGKNGCQSKGVALELETKAVQKERELIALLEQSTVETSQRALRVFPKQLSRQWLSSSEVKITFILPPGAFATSVLQALLDIYEPVHPIA